MTQSIGSVAQARSAYYDTASHDLAAHRVSLWHCIGGSDPGWHLTLPSEPDGKPTTRMSVITDADNVPDALRDTVLAIVRDRPLVPMSPGKVNRNTPGPGRRQSAGKLDPVHRAVGEQFEKLLTWDRAVRVDAPDAVHQMRVTIRTIRSLLQAAPAAFGLSADARLLEELGELAAVLGTARDAEVLAERYQRALDELPAKLVRGPVRTRLVDGAGGRYQAGLRASIAVMRSVRYFRLLDELDALAATRSSVAVDHVERSATETIADAYGRVCKRVKAATAADPDDHDAMQHRVRKSAKRLRYVAAANGAAHVAEAAKAVQALLGDHQDSVVSRASLAEQADAANTAGEDTFTYGLLYQQEIELANECERALPAALKSLGKTVHKAV
jgi:CHAD domain-containing protein